MTPHTDVHINVSSISGSLVFPGPRLVAPDEIEMATDLLTRCQKKNQEGRTVFNLQVGKMSYRVQHDAAPVDGEWFYLRKMPEVPPTLDTLPSPLPNAVKRILLSSKLASGGIVHIAGQPGSGKTTTGSGTCVSRLLATGGMCHGMEDPPENPLNGWHGSGYFRQTEVHDWQSAFEKALRSQPAGARLMMYVGEVRNATTMRMMIRAASSGFLVISTGFGVDLVGAVDTMMQYLEPDENHSLAAVLRVVVHQTLVGGKFDASVLTSMDSNSPVAIAIRHGRSEELKNEIYYQKNARENGTAPDEI